MSCLPSWIFTEAEQKEFKHAFIERIELFPEKSRDGCWIRNIIFNFPIPVNGNEMLEYPLVSLPTVETVVLLVRKRPDDHVRVEMNMEDFDLTTAESKATYQEIKDYIPENHGVKVSSLYIAQTKEKTGIKERENYNVSKNADTTHLQFPKDKEKLIIEALKHFKMILE